MSNLSPEALYGKEQIKEFQAVFEPYIQNYFKEQRKDFENYLNQPHLKFSFDIIEEITLRDAKRLRASFVYFVSKMFGNENEEAALKLGAVIEIIHAYLLILDDFMDMSDDRRGGPTAHKMYEDFYKKHNYSGEDKEHYSNSMAVTAAIVASNMADILLNSIDINPADLLNISTKLHRRIAITGYGQLEDVTNSVKPNVVEEDVLSMLRHKTGVYTYENPIYCGAYLAGVTDEKILSALTDYAIPGGIAFQIKDDNLGMYGDPEIMGKSVMDDMKEGKYTLLVYKAYAKATEEQKKTLDKYIGNRQATSENHEMVKKIIKDTGSLKYSEDKAWEYVNSAQKALRDSPLNSKEYKSGFDYLIGISSYTVERSK